jgi:hypothetical protein
MERIEIVNRVTDGYIECALWASVDDNGERFDDAEAAEVADETLAKLGDAASDFVGLLEREGILDATLLAMSPEQIGHDFWLTRNRHGTGFWDRCLGELGDRLTELAHTYGESHLYRDDDEIIQLA